MKNKLSIIVPIYNVEQYLRKCVDSLLAQDYEDYEIILVDDGNTDSCPCICDEYGQMYDESMYDVCKKCIRVIHQENGGLSAARNAGIKAADGEYICFVDSDDYWEPNVLGGLLAQVEREHLDVLRFDYQNVRVVDAMHLDAARLESATLVYEVFNPNKSPRYVDKGTEIVDGETYLNTRMGYACYAWQFIVRRDIVESFTPNIHFEDVDWMPRMMLKAKRVNSTATIVYNYFWREGSITLTQGNKDKIKKNIEDEMYIVERYATYRTQYPNCQWLRNMQSNMAAGVLTTVSQKFYAERKEYIKRLYDLNVFPLTIADQGKTYVRRSLLINLLGARVYCLLMHLR